MKVPCKNCNKRYLGCHSDCDDYKEYRKYKDEENIAERKRKTYMVTQTQKRILERRGQK